MIYGLAFIAVGFILALEARMPVVVLPESLLWLLAAFGLLHGAHEWTAMAVLIEGAVRPDGALLPLKTGSLVLAAISFAVLGQFGVEWHVQMARWRKWTRAVPGGFLLVWSALAIAAAAVEPAAARIPTAEAVARYFIGLPAALLAASAIYSAGTGWHEPRGARTRVLLMSGAVAFAAYALLAGLVVPPAPFWPASVLNTESFRGAIGAPVMIFRALCAAAVGTLLSLALVFEAARARLEQQRLREEFISVVAHDLRSPIWVIQLGAEVLEKLSPDDRCTENVRKTLGNVKSAATRLDRMVGDLLDASLVEAKHLVLKKESVEPSRFVREVVERASGLTRGHPVRIVAPATMPPLLLDPQRLEQILVNLLSNSAKYSTADTDVVVTIEDLEAEVRVSIENSGSGIPPEQRARLFSRYHRVDAGGDGPRGLGLGLYIVRGLVEAHGGQVWVESEPGKFAAFRFTLPRSA